MPTAPSSSLLRLEVRLAAQELQPIRIDLAESLSWNLCRSVTDLLSIAAAGQEEHDEQRDGALT
jgi:hypothetical protein